MAAATYLCRISGFVLMSRIAITPRVEGAQGPAGLHRRGDGAAARPRRRRPALAALAAAVLAMGLIRRIVVALLAGLAAVGVLRAADSDRMCAGVPFPGRGIHSGSDALSLQFQADTIGEPVAQVAIGVEDLVARALHDRRIGHRPIFDLRRDRTGEFEAA